MQLAPIPGQRRLGVRRALQDEARAAWCVRADLDVTFSPMQFLPDSGWLRMFELKASTGVAAFIACCATLTLAQLDLLHLGALPVAIRTLLVAVALFATVLCSARAWDVLSERWRVRTRRRKALHLDDLGTEELEILADCLTRQEQSFNRLLDDTTATSLRHKALATLPTCSGNIMNHPHIIPDFVWGELRRRSQEIMSAAADLERVKAQRRPPAQTDGW
jgi:hypothetical protein